MSTLNLDESTKAQLSRTDLVTDPANPTGPKLSVTYLCDTDGNRLGQTDTPVLVFRDVFTGKYFAMVAEKIPSQNDAVSVQSRAELMDMEPTHYTNASGSINGWFVEVPGYNLVPKPVSDPAVAEGHGEALVQSGLGIFTQG